MMMGMAGKKYVYYMCSANKRGGKCISHRIREEELEAADSVSVGESPAAALTKPEVLALIFAFYFNMPCLMIMSATAHDPTMLAV